MTSSQTRPTAEGAAPPPPAPATATAAAVAPTQPVKLTGKLAILVELMQRPGGASIYDLSDATGWQLHSIRGAIAGALKAKRFVIISEKPAGTRLYRIEPPKPKRKRGPKAETPQ
ncbi:DUF3489 domain-containing protein [Caulobacter sp. S45]|uniref:DUF3489 domain-containing protein n=1 Tax=Caulobacter sp. S45 TaxID=1641861 RepID=UPI00131DA6F8|nr:DUF3489 domain-containing protein [Caulobacter sp. S45]